MRLGQFEEGEALGQHLPQVRRLVNVRILSRLPEWTARIADVQRVVSKNLFALRQIEARARHLAHVALWLSKNRMSEGFEAWQKLMTSAMTAGLPTKTEKKG